MFSARLYGCRSHKSKRLIESLKNEDGSPRIVTKSFKTYDSALSTPVDRLLYSMAQMQLDALLLLAGLVEKSDVAGT